MCRYRRISFSLHCAEICSIIYYTDTERRITMKFNPINFFNLAIIIIMLVPNVLYALSNKDIKNKCTNKAMNVAEWVGRFGCMLFMVVPFGVGEFGFYNVIDFIVYLFANAALLAVYLIFWKMYEKKPNVVKAVVLAVVPTLIFFICGATLRHFILLACTVMFGVSHIYITIVNNK